MIYNIFENDEILSVLIPLCEPSLTYPLNRRCRDLTLTLMSIDTRNQFIYKTIKTQNNKLLNVLLSSHPLVHKKLSMNIVPYHCMTLILRKDHIQTLTHILDNDYFNVNELYDKYRPFIHKASWLYLTRAITADTLLHLLRNPKTNINKTDSMGITLIELFAKFGEYSMVKYLLGDPRLDRSTLSTLKRNVGYDNDLKLLGMLSKYVE